MKVIDHINREWNINIQRGPFTSMFYMVISYDVFRFQANLPNFKAQLIINEWIPYEVKQAALKFFDNKAFL